MCPLVNANGELLFIGFVLKGKLMVSEALKENLWAEGSVLEGMPKIMANSATGYSSAKINLAQWELGIAHLKKTRPELFPMVCWLDSFSGHTQRLKSINTSICKIFLKVLNVFFKKTLKMRDSSRPEASA